MDGGYYAIKGFEYQVDQTILNILEKTDESEYVSIEKIQDIDTSTYVIQVKYKETQVFYPSSIKKPVIQLIEEFKKAPDKEYYLYAHFKDKNGYDETIKIDSILGSYKNNYSTSDKTRFRAKFKLIFAPNFQEQFEKVINKLIDEEFAKTKDEAVIYYSNIVDYLRKVIINNPPSQKTERKANKKEVFDLISNNRKIIFNSSLLDFQGRVKYYKYIKKHFTAPRKNSNILIVFGNISESSSLNTEELIAQLIMKYFFRATFDIKPPIIVIEDTYIQKVKQYLIEQEVLFNDGYESIVFSSAIFYRNAIINKKVAGNRRPTESLKSISFKVRLISNSTFLAIKSHDIMPSFIYLFDVDLIPEFQDISTIKIDKLDTSEILKLLS